MKPKNYEVLMDIYMGVLNAPAIQFTTEDFGMCQITFSLLEDRITPYNLSNCIVRMVINGQQQDCTISDANNGKAEIVLLQSMFTEVGHVFAELQIYDATNQTLRLTTPRFQYNVRKSLMNNTTVQADPNYSILQNMILEVSSADEVAKQAKKTAESAMTTANQAESKANQIIDNGNYAKEQGDYAKAEGDRLQGMLTIDGTAQTKFDFIKNKVVQDGLVNLVIDKGGVTSNVEFKQDKEFSISVYAQHSVGTSGNKNIVGVQSVYQQYGWFLAMKGDTGNIQLISNTDGKEMSVMVGNVSDGAFHRYDLIYKNHKIAISIDGVFMGIYDLIFTDGGDKRIKTGANSQGQPLNMYKYFYIYDRELFSQEIERNFSVLNNVPSIKELRTTDSTGKTSILKLASDEDHVEMSTGRTLREEYMGVLKTMGKDFTSSDGSPVEVNNGIEARVISGEIKGQTVKNYAKTIERSSFSSVTGQTKIDDMNNIITIDTPTEYSNCFLKKGAELLPNTKYKVVLIILENTLSGPFSINNGAHSGTVFAGSFDLLKGSTGVKEFMFTTKSDVSGDIILRMFAGVGSGRIKLQAMVVEENATTPTSYIPFGLSSTQTIISNNGQQYPIYANEEDKANKKVISLGGVGDVKDTLEISEDGSGVFKNAIKYYDSSDRLSISDGIKGENVDVFNINCNINKTQRPISSYLNLISTHKAINPSGTMWDNESSIHGIFLNSTSTETFGIGLFMPKGTTIQQVETYLSTNRIQVLAQLVTPVITYIPKELIPAILTHKTNILEAGGAVKPSSFKVTVPVDKLAEIEARLQALESTTVDVVLNK